MMYAKDKTIKKIYLYFGQREKYGIEWAHISGNYLFFFFLISLIKLCVCVYICILFKKKNYNKTYKCFIIIFF